MRSDHHPTHKDANHTQTSIKTESTISQIIHTKTNPFKTQSKKGPNEEPSFKMAMNQNFLMDDLTARVKDMTLNKRTETYWAPGATKLVIGKW